MGELTRVTSAVRAQAADVSHISDLAIVDGQLYATSRYDGALESWTISGNGLSLRDTQDHEGSLRPGDIGWITALDLNGGTQLLTGGGTSGGLVLRDPANTGTLPGGTDLPDTMNIYGTVQHTSTVTLSNGHHVVYGGLAGQDGLAQIILDNAGNVVFKRLFSNFGNTTYAAAITGTATATAGGTTYLYTASASENGVSAWSIANNGSPRHVAGMGNDDGLWVSNPTALVSATTGGRSFLVLASAGTDSLSVLRVESDGSLTIVDHLLDTRDTRFGDVAALEVVSHEGAVYVIAGGGDDGITVLQMLPDGQLVTRATLADTTDMTLDNVSAIVARGNGDSLDIFVTSASEDGITRLRYDIGAPGQTLIAAASGDTLVGGTGGDIVIGGIGNDRLTGGQGDDIIRDGGGIDVMTGGAGADIFVLASDGDRDTIMDFEVGVDHIDLSAWPMLRSRDQLTMAMTATGFTITYGDEVLVVHSSTGTTIDHRTLTTDDLMGGARIPQVILPGFAGPVWGTPALPTRTNTGTGPTTGTASVPNTGATVEGAPSLAGTVQIGGLSFLRHQLQPATGRVAFGSMTRDGMRGTDGNDKLFGRAGDDRIDGFGGSDQLLGGGGNDVMVGHAGDDRLDGEDGNDVLVGGSGQDVLIGRAGNDTLNGFTGDDVLVGGSGNDLLLGHLGNDRLIGTDGFNKLFGQPGDDLLYGEGLGDQLFGGGGNDVLVGRGGNDRMEGGDGDDRLFGNNGNDVMLGGAGRDIMEGGAGANVLLGGSGNDSLIGGNGRDVMFGGAGDDRMAGGGDVDTLTGDQGNDWMSGGDSNDTLFGGAGRDVLIGDNGHDRLDGGYDADRLYGGAGQDILIGDLGNDLLDGGDHNDRIFGGAGTDVLYGGAGADLLDGGNDADTLRGGNDNDLLYGGAGRDRLDGENGNDQIFGGSDLDVLTGGNGNDRLDGGWANDVLFGGGGHDVLLGGSGHDTLDGGAGQDSLFGGYNNDTLTGGYDGDWLYGGGGNDTLDGERGNDILAGGLGQDTFIFTTGADRILDFNTAEDRVNLESDLWDGNLIPGDVLFLHGTIIGDNTVLDFGHGDRLVFDGVTDWTALAAQIDYI